MTRSRHKQKALVSSLLLACASAADATPVTVTVTGGSSSFLFDGSSYTYSFAPISNVDELISVSGSSSISASEGGTTTIAVDFVSGKSQVLGGTNNVLSLSSLADVPFPQGDIDGLTFTYSGVSYGNGHVSLESGTVFTFDAVAAPAPAGGVPEPVDDALFLVGGAALWNRLRRRDGTDQLDTSQTNSAYLPPAPRAIGST